MTLGQVLSCNATETHQFSKTPIERIGLLAGHGVLGDAHFGATVQHLSRLARHATAMNLRQVHLIHSELFDELSTAGFEVNAGDLGENITTRDVDLLGLPTGTRLSFPSGAVVQLTGLRNPCRQIEKFRSGLLKAVIDHDADGELIRKAGVMAIVVTSGHVGRGEQFNVAPPQGEHRRLAPV